MEGMPDDCTAVGTCSEPVNPLGVLARRARFIARILLSLFVPIVTFIVLYAGFMFLRDSSASKWVIAIVAIIWGVGGVALLYLVSNWFVERLGDTWRGRLQPFVFVGPAVAILIWYLTLPDRAHVLRQPVWPEWPSVRGSEELPRCLLA